ncbi:MAG: phosphoribosylaminoimidazolesuccinocarboxamide synthase [Chloroflexota bacterium]|nr:phosphoribosylaminoimidazolesuccinocarboxamide synthase [Chloroflexota bacterium]
MQENDKAVVLQTALPCELLHRGKVRDSYKLGDMLLMVATDRISAFDVILTCGIPRKGEILTRLSAFWFDKTSHINPNHFIEVVSDPETLNTYEGQDDCRSFPSYLEGRATVAKSARVIPVECVVRGYITGSAWEEYLKKGTVNDIVLPVGLNQCQQLSEPLFTPTTKAETGHDLPLNRKQLIDIVGEDLARDLEQRSLSLYSFAEEYARERGIIIADTKLEFGFIGDELVVVDEIFTPDSSRFWHSDIYEVGRSQPSMDKQIVRDYLIEINWNREPPPPVLPPNIIEKTAREYREVYRLLTGADLPD